MNSKRVTTILVLVIGVGLVLSALLWSGLVTEDAEQSQPDNAARQRVEASPSQDSVGESPKPDIVKNRDPDRIVLGVVLFNIDNFFKTVGQGMEVAAAEEGVEILFSSANTSAAEETRILEFFLAQEVDAILFSPIDEENVSPPIKTAVDKGIQIVCFNGCFRDEAYQEAQVSAWYTTDQTQLGANTATILAEGTAAQSLDSLKVGWVGCNEGCKPRVEGFLENLDALNIDWELVDGQRGFDEASEAIGVVETLIQKHPEINIVFAENEGTTIGAVQAIKRQGRAGEVFVFGTDISPPIAEMLLADDNILQAVTAQNPHQMGYLAVKAAVQQVKGGEKQNTTYVPVESFRRDQPEKTREYLAR